MSRTIRRDRVRKSEGKRPVKPVKGMRNLRSLLEDDEDAPLGRIHEDATPELDFGWSRTY